MFTGKRIMYQKSSRIEARTQTNKHANINRNMTGSSTMYKNNNTVSWKQTIVFTVLALLAWQLTILPAYAQSGTAEIFGYVFAGSTEQGRVADAQIDLLSTNGVLVTSVETDTNGEYSFSVAAGSYLIQNVESGEVLPVTVSPETVIIGMDFYETEVSDVSEGNAGWPTTSRIVGYVFGGETQATRVVNTEIELLFELNEAPVLGENGIPMVDTTDANGSFSFDVIGGIYLLRNSATGETIPVHITNNVVMVGLDFYNGSAVDNTDISTGLMAPSEMEPAPVSAKIVGYIFAGSTQQGRVANSDVNLLYTDGSLLSTATTDANGNYSFDVPAGSYLLQNTANGHILPVTIAPDVVMIGLDFYNTDVSDTSSGLEAGRPTTSQIVGYVFSGASTSARVVNTEVELFFASDGSPVLGTNGQPMVATTDANGNYSFDVIAGTYLLRNIINGETLRVRITNNVVMVGIDFYDAATIAPLAVSLSNTGTTVSTSWIAFIAIIVLTAVTLPKVNNVQR